MYWRADRSCLGKIKFHELFIKDSERYYYRDNSAEPFWYDFKIDSIHHNSSKDLFIMAIDIITKNLEIIIYIDNETMLGQKLGDFIGYKK